MTTKGCVVSFRDNELVLKLVVVMVAKLCDYTNDHWIVYFKAVDGMVCGLYAILRTCTGWCSDT